MNSQEINEILNGVERLKGNIVECDNILKVLREIQVNYENAVMRPKALLEKLEKIEKDILQDMEILSRDHSVYTKGLKDNIDLIKESCLAIKEDIKNNVDNLICRDTETHNKLMEKCIGLTEEFSCITKKLDSIIEQITQKIDYMVALAKHNKRLSVFSTILAGAGCVLTAVILILIV